jgi:hypothetical protein
VTPDGASIIIQCIAHRSVANGVPAL